MIKKYLPKSLFGRSLMIIILPIAIMQIVVIYLFFVQHWETVTARLSDSVAGDIALIQEMYQSMSNDQRKKFSSLMNQHKNISVGLYENEELPEKSRPSFFSNLDQTLKKALARHLKTPFWFDTTRYPSYIDVRVQLDENVLRYIIDRDRVFANTGYIFVFWMAMATIILTIISILFIRNQVRPIQRLADAAVAFGKGQDVKRFKPAGALEVRKAAQAFMEMRQRIKRYIEQRTLMLASVSHDLRTPITRLKLHLSLLSDQEEIKEAKQDLTEMEYMLDEYLAFAQNEETESFCKTSLIQLIEEVLTKTPISTQHIEFINSEKEILIKTRPIALKRAISNLINNALDYGTQIRISIRKTKTKIYIDIEDNGIGIKPTEYQEAFKPFSRLDISRNQNKKGVGLGLVIARDIIHQHGGVITLGKSSLGGLNVSICLPV